MLVAYESTRTDIRKYSFTSRIANIWSSLRNYVVDVHPVDLFKTRLDEFWRCQDVMLICLIGKPT